MQNDPSFGRWLQQRRQALDLTQVELAQRVGVAPNTVHKIEVDARRPSKEVAQRLAEVLEIPSAEHALFLRVARAELAVDRLPDMAVGPRAGLLFQDGVHRRRIRGYELREQLGTGSSGLVYRAFQSVVNRDVAIKIILPKHANHPPFIRSFEHEAQIIARLEHPHIVPLYDYWRDPGGAYLVMRWMQGGSLQDAIQHGPFTLEKTLAIFQDIVPALDVAHRQRVVHRDLKPANILLDTQGYAYLTDFGIASELVKDDAADGMEWAVFAGSPAYSAPEQIRNEPVTGRTDIYGLGILLFELLAGVHPFGSTTPDELLAKHLEEALPSLITRRPDLPATLDRVISRATAKNPENRYPAVLGLLVDIESAIDQQKGKVAALSPVRGRSSDAMVRPGEAVTSAADEMSPPMTIINPYKGLRAFQEADAADYFGRSTLCRELLGHLTGGNLAGRFLAVVGPSGSGKSSVVHAGLIPALRRGALPGSEAWFIVEMMSGAYPFEELEAALLRVAINPPPTLLEQLQHDERGLGRAIKRVLPADEQIELVLVIDQFEELFTLLDNDDERGRLLESIVVAVTDPRSRVRVIITLRADFYDRPLLYEGFGALVRQHTVVVLPLTGEELSEAVVGPAERTGVVVEPQLVAAMVVDVGMQPGTLPLLQYALTELFEHREGQLLTLAAYRTSGGVQGALGRRADAIFCSLDTAGQVAAQQLFLRLVLLGEGVEDTRRRVRRSELRTIGVEPGSIDEVIDSYVRYRLLTLDRDPVTREPTVELAHEALLRTWSRLRSWLEASREDLRVHQRLMAAEADWTAAGRDSGFLATGTRLAQLELLTEGNLVLSEDERRYIEASVAARDAELQREAVRRAQEVRLERRTRNVLRALVAVLLVSTLGALGLTALTFSQRQEALKQKQAALIQEQEALTQKQAAQAAEEQVRQQLVLADAQRLALAAQGQMPSAPETALLLAYEAVTRNRNPVTEQAVRDALDRVAWRSTTLSGHTDRVIRARFTPDGQHILTASADHSARLWDIGGKQLVVFAGHTDAVNRAVTSPDGLRVLTASLDKTGRLWDMNGKQLALLKGHKDAVNEAVFSVDGAMILTASLDGTARLWDLSGKPLVVFEGHEDEVTSVMFSPDGRTVLTGSADGTARLWDLSGKPLADFKGHTGRVISAAFSPDGRRIATASSDTTAQLWDLSGAPLAVFRGHTNGVNVARFSPDGLTLLTSSQDKTVRLWELNGEQLAIMRGHGDAVPSARFSPDGQRILSQSVDQTARLWDLSGQELAVLSHAGRVIDAGFSSDGQRILTASVDQTARLWEFVGGPLATLAAPAEGVNRALFSPDGQTLITASEDSTARLWDRSGKQLSVLQGHTAAVIRADVSPDGQQILTGSQDATARLWARSGRSLAILRGHADEVTSVRFSPDGRTLLTASADRTMRLWDQAGTELAVFRSHGAEVRSAVFSPDGRTILSASQDGTARLWDTSGQELVVFNGHADEVFSAMFSPDGQRILTCSQDGTARLWDLTGKELVVYTGHQEGVYTARFSPDGQKIVTGSQDGTSRLWDLTGKEIAVFKGHSDVVTGTEFSPDGERIVSKSVDQTARIWDLSGKQIALLSHAGRVIHAEFSPDVQQIVTASQDGTARLWDLGGKELVVLQHASDVVLPGTTPGVLASVMNKAIFSPDSRLIATASQDNSVRLWDINGVTRAVLRGHTGGVVDVEFSTDGQRLVTASTDRTAALWDVSGRQLADFTGHTGRVFHAEFSPDGQSVLTASLDKTLRLWDLDGKERAIFEGHDGEIRSVAFSPDGQTILSVSADKTARLWDVNGKELVVFIGHNDMVTSARFSLDGQSVLTASRDKTARLWGIDGEQIAIFEGHDDWVNTAIFSPDGQQILTASRDTTAQLWDLAGRPLAIMSHTGQVTTIAFTMDGKHIATAGTDEMTRLWDLSGQELVVFKGHSDLVTYIEFSADGRRIVTASRDGTVRQFLVRLDDVLDVATCRVGRGLNADELVRFRVGTASFDNGKSDCPTMR